MEIMAFPGEVATTSPVRREDMVIDSCSLWPHNLAMPPSPVPTAAAAAAWDGGDAEERLVPDLFGKLSMPPPSAYLSSSPDHSEGLWPVDRRGAFFMGNGGPFAHTADRIMADNNDLGHLHVPGWTDCVDSVAPNVYTALPLSPPFSPCRLVGLDHGPPRIITFIVLEDGEDDVSLLNDDPDDDDDDVLPQPTYDVLLTLFQDIYKDELGSSTEEKDAEDEDDDDDDDDNELDSGDDNDFNFDEQVGGAA